MDDVCTCSGADLGPGSRRFIFHTGGPGHMTGSSGVGGWRFKLVPGRVWAHLCDNVSVGALVTFFFFLVFLFFCVFFYFYFFYILFHCIYHYSLSCHLYAFSMNKDINNNIARPWVTQQAKFPNFYFVHQSVNCGLFSP